MIVCIAEKPSVAKDIAKVIGASEAHDGYYEGGGYQVTWSFGHLCELKAPHEYKPEWRSWSYRQLPLIPSRFQIKLKNQDSIRKQFDIIKRLFDNADMIINCGDAGQEGELIQRWIMQLAEVQCPVKRLWINSLTTEAIKVGFKNLKDQSEYQSLYESGLARSIGDWLLGMNATRYYTILGDGSTISIGRVQTPTLSLIVDRQREIDEFNSEEYWTLSTVYKGVTFSSTSGRYINEGDAKEALKRVKKSSFRVVNIETKKVSEEPPHLFDLTSLQVECNKKYGYSAEQTLNIIQSLYEKKYTTYPRVDTTYLPEDVYDKCPNILNGLYGYRAYITPIIEDKLPKRKKIFDNSKVTDHHAIIPTGQTPSNISEEESSVFDMIVKRFISAFWSSYVSANTTVTGTSDGVEFRASGKQVIEPGWRSIYEQSLEDKTLPVFTNGEEGSHKPKLSRKSTTAPAPYTEATLLRAMETCGKTIEEEEVRELLKENGIGRPSTRAAIIETLFRRGYIVRDKKNIIPTELGKGVIRSIKEPILKSARLTGEWEKKLRDIEHHKYNSAVFIDEIKALVHQIVNK